MERMKRMKRSKNEVKGIRGERRSLLVRKIGALAVVFALVLGAFPAPQLPGGKTPVAVAEAKTKKKDKKKPVIKFSGKTKITVKKNQVIKIPKTTAKDNKDGNVTKKISVTVKKGKTSYKSIATKIKKNKKVKFSSAGKYTVTYSVKDKAGNKATKKRYITVTDPKSKNKNNKTEEKTTQKITTEKPTTTEAPTTENQTSSEYPVMPSVDLSKYGTIEKVTVNGVNYNILTNPTDEYYEVNTNDSEASEVNYEKCELGVLAYNPEVLDYLKNHKYLEFIGNIKVIDNYGVDCSNNVFIREWIGKIYTDVYFLFVDSKGNCSNLRVSTLYSNFSEVKDSPYIGWDYVDEEKQICISGHLSDKYKDYNALFLQNN